MSDGGINQPATIVSSRYNGIPSAFYHSHSTTELCKYNCERSAMNSRNGSQHEPSSKSFPVGTQHLRHVSAAINAFHSTATLTTILPFPGYLHFLERFIQHVDTDTSVSE